MLRTTAGRLAVDSALPEDMRDRNAVLDKKGLENLLRQVALQHPEQYREVAHALSRIGHHTAYMTGGNSFGLAHMKKSLAGKTAAYEIESAVKKIHSDPDLSDHEKELRVLELLNDRQKPLEEATYRESLAEHNPLAMQVLSGARGNAMNLKSLRSGDLMYVDHKDAPIPIPVTRSYSEGLTPVQYFAGTFGARKGVLDTKLSVQSAGFMSKQFNQISHRLIVAGHDADAPPATLRGLPVRTDDPDNEGALLAHPAGSYPRNTVLTPRILADIVAQGAPEILVRSPLVGGHPDGGVYARDVGVRERGRLAPVGDYVGIAAAQALSEPLTQSGLSSKHSGGVAGANKAVSGFKLVNQLVQTPKTFQGGASHARVDGRVRSIEPAPQGGHYVTVEGERHHVPQGFGVLVKPGDTVEAGDVLSEGIPNPADVVHHKGIGEGRRYFVKAMMDAYKGSGMPAHRRNVELLASGLINHVRATDEFGDHLPDDVVPYQRLEALYKPRVDAVPEAPSRALGHYLEEPVLHYTIGTKIKPSVVKTLHQFGVGQITVHPKPPPFEPEMIRGMESLSQDPDWMVRFLGSYLGKNLLRGVHRTESSDEAGTSYVPALAKGTPFGKVGPTKGWDPAAPAPLS